MVLQLVQLEGLGQVVVGTGVEAGHPVGGLHPGGEHEDRCPVAVGTQDTTDAEPVDAGHHHVDDERVERLAAGPGQRGHPVHDHVDVVSLEFERAGQGLPDRPVVVDDQNAVRHRTIMRARRAWRARVPGQWCAHRYVRARIV
jgi:hypothetical protein